MAIEEMLLTTEVEDSTGQDVAVASVLVVDMEGMGLETMEEVREESVVLGCSIWLVELVSIAELEELVSVAKVDELPVADGM
jgi:hypothetical protein